MHIASQTSDAKLAYIYQQLLIGNSWLAKWCTSDNQMGQAEIIHIALPILYQLIARLELESVRKILEIYLKLKDFGQTFRYKKICGTNAYILGSRNVLGMFPSLARNYERVVTGSRDWRSKAQ